MPFKDNPAQFLMLDVSLIDPDPAHPRRHLDEAALTGLAHAIGKVGLIHPLLVQPADAAGRHTLIVGERRWRAAVLAGEKTVPALVRACGPDEALELRVFENLGLGLRIGLDPRDMAHAIQAVAERFETREAAARHFNRNPAWLEQATAAAKLSPKVSALLEAGKIASTGAAVQLEKLAQKNEVKAESLLERIEQLPEGEKIARKVVDHALSEEGGRRRKKAEDAPEASPPAAGDAPAVALPAPAADVPPWEDMGEPPAVVRRRVHPGKVKMVAEILGLPADDEDELLARLIDEFLALKGEASPGA